MINDAVKRIARMEEILNALCAALAAEKPLDDALGAMLSELQAYYTGGQWLRDYEMDERGELPADFRRGVLSQDGVYLFLCEARQKGWLTP